MGNFKTHNTPVFDYKLSTEDYWDFHLALDQFSLLEPKSFSKTCLSTYIDISNNLCVDGDNLLSHPNYTWDSAYNDGVVWENIGMTGVDNGLFTYDKDFTTNKEFLNIFFNSTLTTESGDYRLHLQKVDGNNKIYSYDATIENGIAKLNGGFYQGFFKDAGNSYQILPHIIENGWQIEVTLKKEDFQRESPTMRLNDHYPDNKGIFFFIGARSENKWYNYYQVDSTFEPSETNYLNLDILPFETIQPESLTPYLELDYIGNTYNANDNLYNVGSLIDLGFPVYEYKNEELIPDKALDHFIEKDADISPNRAIITKNGLDVKNNDEMFIDTDNKFLLFDRTQDGYTTCTWGDNEENTQFTLQMEKHPRTKDNYFLLFNRTPNGYTTYTINDYLSTIKNKYDVNSDIYRNALAFIINDEGQIGYRYTVKDCDTNSPKIESEFSKFPLIKEGEWHTISIRIKPDDVQWVSDYTCPNLENKKNRTMKMFFYVDGFLKLVTKDLPMLDLRPLGTQPEKQEGVPFNISLGGGTQGLCDTVNLDYKTPPKNVLFTEKNYAGSFIGWIKEFKFYACPQNLTEVRNNLTIIRN